MIINGVTVNDCIGCTEKEIKAYIEYVENTTDGAVTRLTIEAVENGDVRLDYVVIHRKFERIRRITGYLTGDLNTWNNAKKSEEHERVKHA